MLYLDNGLIGSERIIATLVTSYEKLMIPREGKRPSGLEQFQRKLHELYFDKTTSIAEVLAALDSDLRFSSYPKLKKILNLLLRLEDASELAAAMLAIEAIEEKDWVFNPAQFDEYNDHYGYFQEPSEALRKLFQALTEACRIQIIFKEQNNSEQDTLAYIYAYKLMALYLPADGDIPARLYQWIHELMCSAEGDIEHPLHEALLIRLKSLPVATAILDRANWREFVIKEKVKALMYFERGQQIEEKNEAKAPRTMKEAIAALIKCQYSRAEEDPKFAELCHRYSVKKNVFNACLDYISTGWPKKTEDRLPDLVVEGQDAAQGLFWVKLPIQDKRALILGDITHCCQSIGGDSEQCVKDAVNLSSNGLYVLLKQKKSGGAAVIKDGQINEDAFKIVGQSYAWRSLNGNLCLDSLECLTGEVSLEALRFILSGFAAKVFERHTDIRYVTLGCGGKTPKDIFPKAEITEIMKEGCFYGDAKQQYLIARKKPEPTLAHAHFSEVFSKASSAWLDYLCAHATPGQDDFFTQLNEILLTDDVVEKIATFPHHDTVISIFFSLFHNHLLTQANFTLLIEKLNPEMQQSVLFGSKCLSLLDSVGILTQANLETLITRSNSITMALYSELTQGLSELKDGGFLTQTSFELFITVSYSWIVAKGLVCLYQADLLSEANQARLLTHPFYPYLVSTILCLRKSGILTQANFDWVVAHEQIVVLESVLFVLLEANILKKGFDALMLPEHGRLITAEAVEKVWTKIPSRSLTFMNYQRLLQAAKREHPWIELERITNQIIGMVCVRRSVSAAATKLKVTYGEGLNFVAKAQELRDFVDGLSDAPKHQAAKRCIARIMASTPFVDEASGISMLELFALAYVAIQDGHQCKLAFEEASALLVEGLYEMQRGDNMSAMGLDRDGDDLPMSDAGSFNMIMAKLDGVHPAVHLYFLSDEDASAEFPKLVQALAVNYLKKLAASTYAIDYRTSQDLLERIQAAGKIEPIWDKIAKEVRDKMWTQFKEVYGNNVWHRKFSKLIVSGPNVALENIAELKEQMRVAQGLAEQSFFASAEYEGLWAARYESAEAQTAFDKQWGLTLMSSV